MQQFPQSTFRIVHLFHQSTIKQYAALVVTAKPTNKPRRRVVKAKKRAVEPLTPGVHVEALFVAAEESGGARVGAVRVRWEALLPGIEFVEVEGGHFDVWKGDTAARVSGLMECCGQVKDVILY